VSHDPICRSAAASFPAQDERTFAQAWQRYQSDLYRGCLSWTRGRHEEADEALGRAGVLALQKFREHGARLENVRNWLFKLTYNVCMDIHRERRRRREQSLEELLAGAALADPSSAADPEQQYRSLELSACLEQWIAEMPARLRLPMTLHVHRQMRYQEIARSLRITEVNVRKRMQEARRFLRDRLKDVPIGARSRPPGDRPGRGTGR
jgi:RNA polymerase sigma factor (sigma-70 family)